MTIPVPQDDQPCCAHIRVELYQVKHGDGTYSDKWLCCSCKTKFWPALAFSPPPDSAREKARERLLEECRVFRAEKPEHPEETAAWKRFLDDIRLVCTPEAADEVIVVTDGMPTKFPRYVNQQHGRGLLLPL